MHENKAKANIVNVQRMLDPSVLPHLPLFRLLQWLFDIAEMEMAIEAARETGLPVVACMTIGPLGDRTGVTPEECALRMAGAGADVGKSLTLAGFY